MVKAYVSAVSSPQCAVRRLPVESGQCVSAVECVGSRACSRASFIVQRNASARLVAWYSFTAPARRSLCLTLYPVIDDIVHRHRVAPLRACPSACCTSRCPSSDDDSEERLCGCAHSEGRLDRLDNRRCTSLAFTPVMDRLIGRL